MRTAGVKRGPRIAWGRPRSRRLILLLTIIAALVGPATAAWSYWSGFNAPLQGSGVAGSATVNRGATPAVTAISGTSAALTWGASTLSNGRPVDGYRVQRYNASTGVAQVVGLGCSGTITTRSCTEAGLTTGAWRYTVTPILSSNWRGAESTQSGAVVIGTATLTLARTVFGAPLPTTTTGAVAGFAPGESITYTVGGSPTAGSPSTVDAAGNATITALTIPTVAEGSSTVQVTGEASSLVASVGILVDTTPPVVSSSVTPPPNAAGWNRTPVEVEPSANDGSGSGIAYLKLTSDGSDPRTSPTAQVYAGVPVELAATTTIKYYAVDLAGNASAVQTLPVEIDTVPPSFSPQMVDVTGGAFITALPPQPGVAYYRGVAEGSFRFRITMADTGGSGVASLATSSLVDVTTGFTHTPGTGTVVGGVAFTNPFSWTAGTSSTPIGNVTVTDVAGNTTTGGGALYDDSTAPVGGSVDATGLGGSGGRYSGSTTLQLALGSGTDGASGLAATGTQLLRAAAPLSAGDGTANGVCGSYGAYVPVGADPASAVTDTVPVTPSCYRYRYLVPDNVGNVATNQSPDIKVSATPEVSVRPSDATITPINGVGAQSVSGSIVFYNPAQAGSFSVDSSASSPSVGINRMSFPTIAGFTGGGNATTPHDGTTYRTTYAWSANGLSLSPDAQTLTATDNAGGSLSNPNAFSIVKDDVGPGGGAVTVAGLGGTGSRYSTSTTLSLGLVPGTDSGSGLAASGRTLRRASASLSSNGTADGACGSFGTFTPVGGADPTSPKIDTVPADGTCYRYQYLVSDNVGNQTTYTSADIKVATTAPPTPVLAFSDLANTSVTDGSVFYRPAAGSGGFTVTATSADPTSGIAGYGFPSLPAGWSSTSAGSGARTYSWSAPNPTVPSGPQAVTATNNAGGASSSSFTMTPDSAQPNGGTVSYTDGYSTNAAVNVSFTKGTDSGSGLATGSGLLQRASATLSSGACGSFGGFSTVAVNPTSAYSNPVTTGCYRYRYLIADNVGNQATYTSPSIVKVDQIVPSNTVAITNATGAFSAIGGATLFFKGNAPGSFRYVNAVTDAESGPASTDFPNLATSGWTHAAETVSTPAGGPFVSSTYSWTANPGTPPQMSLTGRDAAGKIGDTAVSFVSDVSPPTGTAISYANGVVNTTSLPVSLTNGVDGVSGSGVDPTTAVLRRDVAPLTTTTETCGAFPGTYATTVSLVGGNDTSVTSGNCYRYRYTVSDRVGNTTTVTSPNVAKVDTNGPRVTAITSLQAAGTAGNGRLQIGDKLVLTFNQNLAGVPSSFSGATETSPGILATVILTVPGITDGGVSTGSPLYMLAFTTATFGGTVSLTNNGTATTVTLTVATLTGTAPSTGSGRLVFAPATTIQDLGGNAAGGSFSTATNFKLF